MFKASRQYTTLLKSLTYTCSRRGIPFQVWSSPFDIRSAVSPPPLPIISMHPTSGDRGCHIGARGVSQDLTESRHMSLPSARIQGHVAMVTGLPCPMTTLNCLSLGGGSLVLLLHLVRPTGDECARVFVIPRNAKILVITVHASSAMMR